MLPYSASSLRQLPPEALAQAIDGLSPAEADAILHDWAFWRRDDQAPPDWDWSIWLLIAGRGAGKTRTGAEWVRSQVMAGHRRIALVAPTAADARDTMVEGDSGILSVCWENDRDHKGRVTGIPTYEVSKRRLTWKNGAVATLFSAEKPERLRGPQHSCAWADELVAWKYLTQTWDMLMFGLRLGRHPQVVVTSTPKPIKLLRELIADPHNAVTKASTYANRENLAASFFTQVIRRYEGTRLGRQELNAEILEDTPGALWQRSNIDDNRRAPVNCPDLARLVVAVDPAVSNTAGSDETGIVVAGRGKDKRGYVLEDRTMKGSPDEWGRQAVLAYFEFHADAIVAEVNNGGDLVGAVVRQAAIALRAEGLTPTADVVFRAVHASRGKVTRAEPVSALYEQNRVSHVGSFADLEDQMCQFTSDFDRKAMGFSPDRVDALVWALTDVMLTGKDAKIIKPAGAIRTSPWTGA